MNFGPLMVGAILVPASGPVIAWIGDESSSHATANEAAEAIRQAHQKTQIERDRLRVADHLKKFADPTDIEDAITPNARLAFNPKPYNRGL